MRLSERRVVVLGGAGEVGEGICRILLREGAQVGVPSRTPERLDQLRASIEDANGAGLTTFVGRIDDAVDAVRVREGLEAAMGSPTDVVVCLGGWWQGGRLVEIPLSEWTDKVGRDGLVAHLVAVRTWLPALLDRGSGSFLLINGGTALHATPGSGLVNMAAAAQLMMKDVLVAEHPDAGVRINSLLLTTPILSRRLRSGDPAWLDGEEVGRMVAHLLSDEAVAVHGESIVLDDRSKIPKVAKREREV